MKDDSTTVRPAFDRDELLGRCMGNEDLMRNLLARFRERIDAELSTAAGLVEKDNRALAALAHRLKGLAANLAAHSMHNQAARLEQLALEGESPLIGDCLEELRAEVSLFNVAVDRALEAPEPIQAA